MTVFWLIDAMIEIEKLEKDSLPGLTFGDEESKDYQTLAGFVIKHLGRVPKEGEDVRVTGLWFRDTRHGQAPRGQSARDACQRRRRRSEMSFFSVDLFNAELSLAQARRDELLALVLFSSTKPWVAAGSNDSSNQRVKKRELKPFCGSVHCRSAYGKAILKV